MSTNFPTSLDALTNPTSTDTLDTPDHATQHADANDAIEALQAKVGVDSSAVTSSIDYKIANTLAPLASPTFTGTPAAPTAAVGTNTTQVATTAYVQSELPWFNVLDYGATGDGTTDDTTAIQAALTAASGASLFFPPGTYVYASDLTVPSNTRVFGAGWESILKITDNGLSGNRSVLLNAVSNVLIENMRITQTATSRTGVYGNIRMVGGTTGVIIRGCRLDTSPASGIFMNNVSDILIQGNRIDDTYADGILLNNTVAASTRVRIIGNEIYAVQDDGIAVNSDTAAKGQSADVTIAGNIVESTSTLGSGVAVTGGIRVAVTGNKIKSVVGSGIRVGNSAGATYTPSDITIAGNVVYDAQKATEAGIYVSNANYVAVTGNTVDSSAHHGIALISAASCTVAGNTVTNSGTWGILEDSGSSANSITGNSFASNTSGNLSIAGTNSSVIANSTGAWTIPDAVTIALGTTTGTKIGTATTQKLGFWNATPVAQQSGTGETVGFTAGTGTGVNDDSTFTGNVGSTAYRISDIVKALKNIGALAS